MRSLLRTQVVTNVAMSSSSPEDDDCIVAVKFLGPQLSLCRPAQKKPEWVNIRITDPGFFSSRVMYSKKEKMFSMPTSGGLHLGSWDLEKHIPQDLHISFYSGFDEYEWDRLAPCCRSEHLVESPTGQTFLVKWYTGIYWDGMAFAERFLVLEIKENGVTNYTEDIGDLCIFLSHKGEPFCLQASLYDLSPNFIYYLGTHDYGKLNLSDYQNANFLNGYTIYQAPYFIPPQS